MKKQESKVDWRVLLIAIVGLVVIEVFALANGINGVLRSSIIAIIALIAGITMPQWRTK